VVAGPTTRKSSDVADLVEGRTKMHREHVVSAADEASICAPALGV
jgi:hypothetical protein